MRNFSRLKYGVKSPAPIQGARYNPKEKLKMNAEGLNRKMSLWLRSLPEDVMIAWSDDGLTNGFNHVFSSWLDIHIPLAEAACGVDLIWTIDVAEQAENRPESFSLPRDGLAFVVVKGSQKALGLVCYEDGSTAELTDSEIYTLKCDQEHYIDGYKIWIHPVVRIESVSEYLKKIVFDISGREDISFRFEPSIEPSSFMLEAIQRLKETIQEVKISEEAIDPDNLEDPEWVAQTFGLTPKEAEEEIIRGHERVAAMTAKYDQLEAEERETARRLLKRFKSRLP